MCFELRVMLGVKICLRLTWVPLHLLGSSNDRDSKQLTYYYTS